MKVEPDFKALFERLAAELPPGVARVNTYTLEDGGAVVELLLANSASANFGIHTDRSEFLDFSMVGGTWEFPWERRYKQSEKDYITEVEEMSRAIIAGQCDVTHGWISDTYRIHVGDYTYGMIEMPKLRLWPRETRRFAPYVEVLNRDSE